VVQAIEAQGGAQLTEPCVSRRILPTVPPYKSPKVMHTQGCNHYSRAVIEYNGEDSRVALATVCLVCDNVGLMPRFNPAFEDAHE
jgi:hypothetical protein